MVARLASTHGTNDGAIESMAQDTKHSSSTISKSIWTYWCKAMGSHAYDNSKRDDHEYDNITHHHKHRIDKESLLAGTGYAVEYNQRIIGGANHVLKHNIKNIHW